MTKTATRFAELLTTSVRTIAARQNRTIASIQDEVTDPGDNPANEALIYLHVQNNIFAGPFGKGAANLFDSLR